MRWIPASLLMLAACSPADIRVRGRIERARVRPDTFLPLALGEITLLDAKGDLASTDQTDANGFFSATAPAGQTIYAEIRGEGLVPSSFTGITGAPDTGALVVGVDDRQDTDLYGVLTGQVEELRQEFTGCPRSFDDGGIVFGEVRVADIVDPVTDEEPLVGTAWIDLTDADGNVVAACYLGEDGLYDVEATVTGASGRFAAFGLAPGRWEMGVRYLAFDTDEVATFSPVWVPEEPVSVAPRQPAWVEFPF